MMSRPQGHSPTRRIKSKNNSSDPIGNQTPNLSASSTVPQPTAPPCTRSPVGGQGIFFSPKIHPDQPWGPLYLLQEGSLWGKPVGMWRWPPTPNLMLGLCIMACYRENITFSSSNFQHCVSNLLVNGETHPPSRGVDERSRASHNSINRSHLYNY
jgi:hypothetical protein